MIERWQLAIDRAWVKVSNWQRVGAAALKALRLVATVSKPLFADDLNSRNVLVVKSKLQRGLMGSRRY